MTETCPRAAKRRSANATGRRIATSKCALPQRFPRQLRSSSTASSRLPNFGMTEFSYLATDADGTTQSGVLHAQSEDAARNLLERKGFTVVELRSLGMPWTAID